MKYTSTKKKKYYSLSIIIVCAIVLYHTLSGRLYTYDILYFASIFAIHTTKYETLTTHFHISFKFRVLLKKSFDFLHKCRPRCEMLQNVKYEKGGVKREESGAKYPAIRFLFFAFCEYFWVFRNKCIASLTVHVS